ncbi:luciferase family protein [Halalkalibacter lacteus]|uniref:luciferase domain-containing protein n=1 Tax=Halalkalibacter lacteus TaxID=3090663 RepID=UPI002FC910C0
MILESLRQELLSMDGVSEHTPRFGGVEFRYKNKELDMCMAKSLHFPFPKSVRDELIQARLAEPHHILPNSDWVSFWIT